MKICQSCEKKFQDGILFCPDDGQRLIDYIPPDGDYDQFIGLTIDKKYRIDSKIAKGGMSNVYLATHMQLDMQVAVKIMHERYIPDANAIKRFRREAQSAMQIRHTNAITVMDFGVTDNNIVYLIMEYLQGQTLREKLTGTSRLPLSEANSIMQQICGAVRVAHRRGIVHRDIKPDNIFLEKDADGEVVKVLDFGIAKFQASLLSENLTQTGNVLGSPQYMSPEQFGEGIADSRSDVYSLGVVLYELLVGELPFKAKDVSKLAYQHMTEKPRSVLVARPDLPASLDQFLTRVLSKLPEQRPHDAGAFAEELQDAVSAVLAPPTPTMVEGVEVGKDHTVTDGSDLLRMYARPEWPTINIPDSLKSFEINSVMDAFFLPDFFGALAHDRVTGTTWFSSGMTTKGVIWQNGEIVFALSNDQTERLGERLVRQGRIQRRQFDEAIRWQYEREQASIVDALIQLKYLTTEMIHSLMSAHIYSICYSLIDWEEGSYAFDATPYQAPTTLSLSVDELIIESSRSLIDIGRIKAFLGNTGQYWQVKSDWAGRSRGVLRPDDAALLERLKTPHTIAELTTALDLPEEQILRIICALQSLRVIATVEAPKPTTGSLVPDLEAMSLFCYQVENTLAQINRADDHFAVLGIGPQATADEIEASYQDLSQRFDPASHQVIVSQIPTLAQQLETILKRVKEAHRVLSDATERTNYLTNLKRQSGRMAKIPTGALQKVENNPPETSRPSAANPPAPTASQPANQPASSANVPSAMKPPTPAPAIPVTPPAKSTPPVTPAKPNPVPAAPAPPASTAPPATPIASVSSVAERQSQMPAQPASMMGFGDPSRLRNPDDWYLYGLELLDKGDAERACRAFLNAIKWRPQDAEFHAALARAYAQMYGYNAQSVQEFEQAIKLKPKSADYPAELGAYYLQYNHIEKATQYIEQALSIDSQHRGALRAKKKLPQ